jgi:hypothetical protein
MSIFKRWRFDNKIAHKINNIIVTLNFPFLQKVKKWAQMDAIFVVYNESHFNQNLSRLSYNYGDFAKRQN